MKIEWSKRFKNKFFSEGKVIVLMYHRIANLKNDPWQLAVSPSNFEQHLQVLKNNFQVISTQQLIKYLNKQHIPANMVCITFDDGYSDNYHTAIPLLKKYNYPVTFFVSNLYVDQVQSFWWDELEDIILNTLELPTKLQIEVNNEPFVFEFKNNGLLTQDEIVKQSAWVWRDKPPTQRSELYLSLWERLRPLPYTSILQTLNKLREWSKNYNKIANEDLPMAKEQLNEIGNHPLFEIGVHTVTHPALACHSAETQEKEIVENKKQLQKSSKKPITTIAYPYGNFNDTSIAVVKEQKLRAAFTTEERIVTKGSELYRLGRYQAKNWDGEEFKKQISRWFGAS